MDAVLPNPVSSHSGTTVPMPILARFLIAWKATCGSSAHAWTAMSPPVYAGSKSSSGNGRSAARLAGRLPARPNRLSNSVGPCRW